MDEETFEKRFAEMLRRFDDLFDQEENYIRHAKFISESMPEASDVTKAVALQHLIDKERTNNLIRVALKEFLVND